MAAAYFPFPLNLAQRLGLLVLAIGISVLSFAFIETPFQHAKRLSRRSYSGLILWPVAVSMIVVVAIVAAPDVTFAGGFGPAKPGETAPAAIIAAVRAAKAGDSIPRITTPSIPDAIKDYELIGDCSAWKHRESRICQFGDPEGKKTIVVFGNSHSVMWIPAVRALALQAKWQFFPVVKEACGYDDYAALRGVSRQNQCVTWRLWALSVIQRLHPDVVVVGVYAFRQWDQGLSIILPEIKHLTKRVVIIADTPGIAKIPGYCLAQPGAIQNTCLWPESEPRIIAVGTARQLAIREHVGFVDPESWFCFHQLCPSVVNTLIPYSDNGHLTRAYSCYLAAELAPKLDLTGRIKAILPKAPSEGLCRNPPGT